MAESDIDEKIQDFYSKSKMARYLILAAHDREEEVKKFQADTIFKTHPDDQRKFKVLLQRERYAILEDCAGKDEWTYTGCVRHLNSDSWRMTSQYSESFETALFETLGHLAEGGGQGFGKYTSVLFEALMERDAAEVKASMQ